MCKRHILGCKVLRRDGGREEVGNRYAKILNNICLFFFHINLLQSKSCDKLIFDISKAIRQGILDTLYLWCCGRSPAWSLKKGLPWSWGVDTVELVSLKHKQDHLTRLCHVFRREAISTDYSARPYVCAIALPRIC